MDVVCRDYTLLLDIWQDRLCQTCRCCSEHVACPGGAENRPVTARNLMDSTPDVLKVGDGNHRSLRFMENHTCLTMTAMWDGRPWQWIKLPGKKTWGILSETIWWDEFVSLRESAAATSILLPRRFFVVLVCCAVKHTLRVFHGLAGDLRRWRIIFWRRGAQHR